MKVGGGLHMERKGKEDVINVRCEALGYCPPLARGFKVKLPDGPEGQCLPHFIPVDAVPSTGAWFTDYPGWL